MSGETLAKRVLERLRGIDEEDLTTAEKQIKEICKEILK